MDTIRHHENSILHKEEHLTSSAFITDIVIGMSDGLTVPFALAAGLSGAVDSNALVVTAGIAEIVAGSIAMGLGGFLAGQTEVEHYDAEQKREYWEIENLRQREIDETKEIFAEMGLSPELQEKVTQEIAKDKNKWVEFMMKYELGLEKPDPNQARKSALTIGISYAFGGMVPLLPYFFTSTPFEGLIWSAVTTLICLFIFGYFKSKATGQHPWLGALKVTLIGAVAAAAAFGVAKLFE
ncbi:VIT1/CCC1 family predicted Fe2+/Mn2+ transporter [Runella defluvii]|uniref:VIT1/CCC1 family predicted Fe2+/Mn2+ transporter n=1 Tax=Runella defluvii TaxID=370973 RepID=A0A7W5ZMG1_9BACT|nr:VIT1/CCC1 transporter family protein [Runella defluvii]MBB3839574.1 VIT1/CCC1 family predicted Fe2+/Mn2+ transporter [Runella defluvii]